eukprot:GHVS01026735.1.p1 GENE.GHVS01026735.1~~GHVS01026735.1.p1  ORF type:complete len:961 (+),score=205.71 GHVS01026735.1:234-3116(+)
MEEMLNNPDGEDFVEDLAVSWDSTVEAPVPCCDAAPGYADFGDPAPMVSPTVEYAPAADTGLTESRKWLCGSDRLVREILSGHRSYWQTLEELQNRADELSRVNHLLLQKLASLSTAAVASRRQQRESVRRVQSAQISLQADLKRRLDDSLEESSQMKKLINAESIAELGRRRTAMEKELDRARHECIAKEAQLHVLRREMGVVKSLAEQHKTNAAKLSSEFEKLKTHMAETVCHKNLQIERLKRSHKESQAEAVASCEEDKAAKEQIQQQLSKSDKMRSVEQACHEKRTRELEAAVSSGERQARFYQARSRQLEQQAARQKAQLQLVHDRTEAIRGAEQRKATTLQKALQECEHSRDMVVGECRLLKLAEADLLARLERAEGAKKTLTDRVEASEVEVAELSRAEKREEKKARELGDEVEGVRRKLESAERTRVEEQIRLQAMHDKAQQRLREQAAQQLAEQEQEWQRENNRLQQRLAEQPKIPPAVAQEMARVAEDLVAAETALEDKSNEISKLKSTINSLEQERVDTEHIVSGLRQNLLSSSQNLSSVERDKDNMQHQVGTLTDELRKLGDALAEAIADKEKVQTQWVDERSALEAKAKTEETERATEHEQLRRQLKEHKNKQDQQREQITTLIEQDGSLKAKLDSQVELNKNQQQTQASAQKELETLRVEKKESEESVRSLQEEITKKSDELRSLKEKHRVELEAAEVAAADQMASSRRTASDAEQDLEMEQGDEGEELVVKTLESVTKDNNRLKDKFRTARDKYLELAAKYEELRVKKLADREEVEKLTANVKRLEAELKAAKKSGGKDDKTQKPAAVKEVPPKAQTPAAVKEVPPQAQTPAAVARPQRQLQATTPEERGSSRPSTAGTSDSEHETAAVAPKTKEPTTKQQKNVKKQPTQVEQVEEPPPAAATGGLLSYFYGEPTEAAPEPEAESEEEKDEPEASSWGGMWGFGF